MWPTTGTWAFCASAGIRATPQIATCRPSPCNQWKQAMSKRSAVGLAILAGFGLGIATIQGLGAKDTAPVLLVAEVKVTDLEGYMKEYFALVQKSLERHAH